MKSLAGSAHLPVEYAGVLLVIWKSTDISVGATGKRLALSLQLFSTSTNHESSCDVVLFSTEQHNALVDPSTRREVGHQPV